jgi:molecular chaperone DnaK
MTGPAPKLLPLRIRLPYATEEEFIERYGSNVGRGGVFVATRALKPEGTGLAFEFVLSDGGRLLRGEGVVIKADASASRTGMTVRFTKLDAVSKALIDRIVARRSGTEDSETVAAPPSSPRMETASLPPGLVRRTQVAGSRPPTPPPVTTTPARTDDEPRAQAATPKMSMTLPAVKAPIVEPPPILADADEPVSLFPEHQAEEEEALAPLPVLTPPPVPKRLPTIDGVPRGTKEMYTVRPTVPATSGERTPAASGVFPALRLPASPVARETSEAAEFTPASVESFDPDSVLGASRTSAEAPAPVGAMSGEAEAAPATAERALDFDVDVNMDADEEPAPASAAPAPEPVAAQASQEVDPLLAWGLEEEDSAPHGTGTQEQAASTGEPLDSTPEPAALPAEDAWTALVGASSEPVVPPPDDEPVTSAVEPGSQSIEAEQVAEFFGHDSSPHEATADASPEVEQETGHHEEEWDDSSEPIVSVIADEAEASASAPPSHENVRSSDVDTDDTDAPGNALPPRDEAKAPEAPSPSVAAWLNMPPRRSRTLDDATGTPNDPAPRSNLQAPEDDADSGDTLSSTVAQSQQSGVELPEESTSSADTPSVSSVLAQSSDIGSENASTDTGSTASAPTPHSGNKAEDASSFADTASLATTQPRRSDSTAADTANATAEPSTAAVQAQRSDIKAADTSSPVVEPSTAPAQTLHADAKAADTAHTAVAPNIAPAQTQHTDSKAASTSNAAATPSVTTVQPRHSDVKAADSSNIAAASSTALAQTRHSDATAADTANTAVATSTSTTQTLYADPKAADTANTATAPSTAPAQTLHANPKAADTSSSTASTSTTQPQRSDTQAGDGSNIAAEPNTSTTAQPPRSDSKAAVPATASTATAQPPRSDSKAADSSNIAATSSTAPAQTQHAHSKAADTGNASTTASTALAQTQHRDTQAADSANSAATSSTALAQTQRSDSKAADSANSVATSSTALAQAQHADSKAADSANSVATSSTALAQTQRSDSKAADTSNTAAAPSTATAQTQHADSKAADTSSSASSTSTAQPPRSDTQAADTATPSAATVQPPRSDTQAADTSTPSTSTARPPRSDTQAAASSTPSTSTARPPRSDTQAAASSTPNTATAQPPRSDATAAESSTPNTATARPPRSDTQAAESSTPNTATAQPPRSDAMAADASTPSITPARPQHSDSPAAATSSGSAPSPRADTASTDAPPADAQNTSRSRRRTLFDLAPAVPTPAPAAAEIVLGIDVGTSQARVAAFIDGVATPIPLPGTDGTGLPSIVAVDDSGELRVGTAALAEASRSPRNATSGLKRLLGLRARSPNLRWLAPQLPFPVATDLQGDAGVELDGRVISPAAFTTQVLRELHQAATAFLGRKVTRAVLCAPSHFTERQRATLRDAALQAGLDVPRVLTNSAAAALAYAHGRGLARKRVLVVDLGGGGLEVCVVQVTGDDLEVVTTGGDPTLGGMEFDARVAEALVSDLADKGHPRPEHPLDWGPLRTVAEATKQSLSTRDSVDVTLPSGPGPTLDRERVEALTADLAQRVVSVTREVLETNALSPQGLDAVLLVGGQSRAPLVRRRLEESLGVPVTDDVDARTAVVRGAALLGHALLLAQVGKPAASVSEVLTSPIGVAEDGGVFRRVLERNTRLPTAKTLVIPLTVPGPLSLAFFQGTAATAAENEWLGAVHLTVERPGEVEVHLELSTDGTLAFSATLPGQKRQPVALATGDLDDAARDALVARSPFHTEPEARPSGLLSGLKKLFGRR